jgi:hypothetical protein
MTQSKKSIRLRSGEPRRQSPKAKNVVKSVEAADRRAIKRTLARHDINSATKKIIENLAVEYGPALKNLADR